MAPQPKQCDAADRDRPRSGRRPAGPSRAAASTFDVICRIVPRDDTEGSADQARRLLAGLLCRHHRVIRIEFQVRRAKLKELGIDTIDDLFERRENLWAYCARQWLQVQDQPGKHHTQRGTVPWWQAVQAGFPGAQHAKPLIRSKAISMDREQLVRQVYGNWVSLIALDSQDRKLDAGAVIVLDRQIVDLLDHAAGIGLNDAELTKRVELSLAKFQRGCAKHVDALHTRRRLGLCCEGPSHYGSMP